jgi:hypothetical protein
MGHELVVRQVAERRTVLVVDPETVRAAGVIQADACDARRANGDLVPDGLDDLDLGC